jgi:predicted permease
VRLRNRAGSTSRQISQDGLAWEAIREGVDGIDAAPFSGWTSSVNLVAGDRAARIRLQRIGAGYFAVLGIAPALGRELLADEDVPNGPARAVLGHELWRREFDGDPDIVGSTVRLRGEPHVVVGVMPPGFDAGVDAQVWTPLRPQRGGEGGGTNYGIAVRPHDGVSWSEAAGRIDAALRAARRAAGAGVDSEGRFGLWRIADAARADQRSPLLVLSAAVALVLLVACVNVAGLLLARAHGRAREIATRRAIGGGRGAVVRQLLVESLVLSALGGTLGVALGAGGLAALRRWAGGLLTVPDDAALDLRALGATALVSLVATLLCGLAPALVAGRFELRAALHGGRSVAGSRHPLRRVLVAGQVALATALLVAAGLLLRTFGHLSALDPGFDAARLVAARASLADARYGDAGRVGQLLSESVDRLSSQPGVESATVALGLPYERLLNMGFDVPGIEPPPNGWITNLTYVTPGYFATLDVPVLRGRPIDARDRHGAPDAVAVSESFARLYFGDEPALGRRIEIAARVREIVGVVGDVQQRPSWSGDFGPLAPMPLVYAPVAQLDSDFFALVHTWFEPAWIVRTAEASRGVAPAIGRSIAEVDPGLAITEVESVAAGFARVVAPQRALLTLLGGLGALSLVLAAVGCAGMVASEVSERRRELGIRIALGATRSRTVGLIALPGLRLSLAGAVAGAALALAFGGLLRAWLWGVTAHDPGTITAVALLLVAVVGITGTLAALRVLAVEPAEVLRVD